MTHIDNCHTWSYIVLMTTAQWSTQKSKTGQTITGYAFARAAAQQIQQLGHTATAHRGPVSIQSPDDDDRGSERIGHVHSTEDGIAAYSAWRDARRTKS